MKTFILNMLSESEAISSKRVSAFLLIILFIGGTILSIFIDITSTTKSLLELSLYMSIGLLVGTMFKNKLK